MSEVKTPRRSGGKYLRKKEDTGIGLAAPFLVTLALFTVISFIIPLRPTRSQMEKRELAVFPEFSWRALAEGTYFDDITTWFSDTFPGRESWLELSSGISSLHGHSEISIAGELPSAEIAAQSTEPSAPVQTDPSAETQPPPRCC